MSASSSYRRVALYARAAGGPVARSSRILRALSLFVSTPLARLVSVATHAVGQRCLRTETALIKVCDRQAEHLSFLRRQLFRTDFHRDLVDRAGEPEGHLIVGIIYRRASVHTYVERFAPPDTNGYALRHRVPVENLTVEFQRSGATLAKSGTVILPVELESMLPRF